LVETGFLEVISLYKRFLKAFQLLPIVSEDRHDVGRPRVKFGLQRNRIERDMIH